MNLRDGNEPPPRLIATTQKVILKMTKREQ